jgi:hypothetical protein
MVFHFMDVLKVINVIRTEFFLLKIKLLFLVKYHIFSSFEIPKSVLFRTLAAN